MIIPRTDDKRVQYDELATLKKLALDGAIGDEIEISCASMGDELEVSTQTVSRRLRQLENADFIRRERTNDGQRVTLLPDGIDALRHEYDDYRRIFDTPDPITLVGHVTSGMGRGRHFITLPGYDTQFRDRLGYQPYPGTLNVELTTDTATKRTALETLEAIPIDSWEDDGNTYGAATAYPATIEPPNAQAYTRAHLLVPDRTDHAPTHVELIAPDHLRDHLDLADNDQVTIHVEEP